jgi:hypothetical protein
MLYSRPKYALNHNPEFTTPGGTMARNAARLKMGYYPLPESEAARLRALLNFSGAASVVDPCVGQGTAFHIITQSAEVRRVLDCAESLRQIIGISLDARGLQEEIDYTLEIKRDYEVKGT